MVWTGYAACLHLKQLISAPAQLSMRHQEDAAGAAGHHDQLGVQQGSFQEFSVVNVGLGCARAHGGT